MLAYDLVIPAAGSGRRMGASLPKPFLQLQGKDILEHTLEAFLSYPPQRIIIAVDESFRERIASYSLFKAHKNLRLLFADGGPERQDSILNALEFSDSAWVAVHDAVRPFISKKLLASLIAHCEKKGSAVPAIIPRDTIKEQSEGVVIKTLERQKLVQVQTPQFFSAGLYQAALNSYDATKAAKVTDDASLLEMAGFKIHLVEGERMNQKLTYPEDLQWAEWFLQQQTI